MIIQLYQVKIENPEAYLLDFNCNDQTSILVDLVQFLKDQSIDVIGVNVNWHDKNVSITYIFEQRRKEIVVNNGNYIFKFAEKSITQSSKKDLFSSFGLTDDFSETNQDRD